MSAISHSSHSSPVFHSPVDQCVLCYCTERDVCGDWLVVWRWALRRGSSRGQGLRFGCGHHGCPPHQIGLIPCDKESTLRCPDVSLMIYPRGLGNWLARSVGQRSLLFPIYFLDVIRIQLKL